LLKYFPKIINIDDKYKAYKTILKHHPDLLTNDILRSTYKLTEPESLEEFQNSLSKFRKYNTDMNNLGLLIKLLLK
jgi:hypothetical protein